MILKKNHILSAAMRMIAAAVIICIAVCLGRTYDIQAATYDIVYDVAAPKLEAERTEDVIILSWVAAADTDLDGFSGKLSYDKEIFSYSEDDLTLAGLLASVEPVTDIIVAIEQNPQRTVFSSGEAIFTLKFHLKDGAQIAQSTDYVFSFTLNKDAYTYDLDDYSWCGDTFTLTYREEADGTAVVDSEVIPDPDPVTNQTADTASAQNSGSSSGSSQAQGTAGQEGVKQGNAGSAGTGNAASGTPSVSWQAGSSSGSVPASSGSANASSGNTRASDSKPATGDHNNLYLWLGIAIGAAAVLCVAAVLLVKRRRKQ